MFLNVNNQKDTIDFRYENGLANQKFDIFG